MTLATFAVAVHKTGALLARGRTTPLMPCRVEDKPWVTEHLAWMLDRALEFCADGRPQKANRWLGFVQGVLSTCGVSLEELKQANMPEGERFDASKV